MEQTSLTRTRLLELLTQLEAGLSDYITVVAQSASFPAYAVEAARSLRPFAPGLAEALEAEPVLREAQRFSTGAVIFWSGNGQTSIVLPPFPLPENRISRGGADTSLLRQLLQQERVLALVLVTWGSYALGVFRGSELVEAKTGTGYIHKAHRKGGRSQKRFARRTEEQKKDFLRRVANRTEEKLKGYPLEQVFFGGNRLILKPLLAECPYLRSESHRISGRLLNVRYADREALFASWEDVYRSTVFSF